MQRFVVPAILAVLVLSTAPPAPGQTETNETAASRTAEEVHERDIPTLPVVDTYADLLDTDPISLENGVTVRTALPTDTVPPTHTGLIYAITSPHHRKPATVSESLRATSPLGPVHVRVIPIREKGAAVHIQKRSPKTEKGIQKLWGPGRPLFVRRLVFPGLERKHRFDAWVVELLGLKADEVIAQRVVRLRSQEAPDAKPGRTVERWWTLRPFGGHGGWFTRSSSNVSENGTFRFRPLHTSFLQLALPSFPRTGRPFAFVDPDTRTVSFAHSTEKADLTRRLPRLFAEPKQNRIPLRWAPAWNDHLLLQVPGRSRVLTDHGNVLLRVRVNDQPVSIRRKHVSRALGKIRARRLNEQQQINRVTLPLHLDPEAIPAEPGDRVSLQLLFSSSGTKLVPMSDRIRNLKKALKARSKTAYTPAVRTATRTLRVTSSGDLRPSLSSALSKAAWTGTLDRLRGLLPDKSANETDPRGRTPLMWAAYRGHKRIVNHLLDAGADVDATDAAGFTPADYALFRKHTDVFRTLRKRGADTLDGHGLAGRTALIGAVRKGDADTVDLLVRAGMPVDLQNAKEVTPLLMAARRGHRTVARLLIEAGARPNRTDTLDRHALMHACDQGHTDLARLLIERGADVHHARSKGITPLFLSVKEQHLDCVKLLLRAGADPNGSGSRRPLVLATRRGNPEVVRMLLNAGANPYLSGSNGPSAIEVAREHERDSAVTALLRRQPMRAFRRATYQPLKKRRDRRVRSLINQLGARSYAKRQQAMNTLASIGNDARYYLKKNLDHPNLEIRKRIRQLVLHLIRTERRPKPGGSTE